MKTIIKIALSIVIGILLMRFGYIVKNDYLSLGMQALGYIIISYPFYLFFKFTFLKIKNDIFRMRIDKKFYSEKGGIYGFVKVGSSPLKTVKCIVKNSDGSNNKWTHRWINVTNELGYYELNYIPNGEYICQFTHTFMNGTYFTVNKEFEIKGSNRVNVNLDIKEKTEINE